MKIGINASFLRKTNTGIGQYTLNVVGEMLKLPTSLEHQFHLYFEDKESRDLVPSQENVIKKTVDTPFYKRDDLIRKTSWEKALLPRQARRDGIEIFFSPYNAASSFPLTRHVITLHDVVWKVYEKDYVNNFRKNIYTKQTFDAVKRASQIVTVSEYSKKDIVKYLNIDSGHITVVKNGVAECFHPIENKKKVLQDLERLHVNFPYIFYMGGFEKRKNVGLLLSAFSKVVKSYPNILKDRKLVIAGEVWDREDPLVTNVPKITEQLGIEDNVTILGKVLDDDRISLYNGADLFVFPSLYEGFGMTVLEAMACGCPVLASSRTSIPEVGSDAIEYFNPDREDELVQQMNRLLSDSVERSLLSQKGINRARHFSWKEAAERTLGVLLG